MKCRWSLSAVFAVCLAHGQQSTGGGTGNGTVGTVLPQVAPGLQQNNTINSGGGISFVTRRTPTAVTANQARGFFAAGGVNLGGAAVGAGGGSVGAVDNLPITAGVQRRPVALPSESELASTAAAAQRGDAKAQARLEEYRRALTGQAAPPTSGPTPTAAVPTTVLRATRTANPSEAKHTVTTATPLKAGTPGK